MIRLIGLGGEAQCGKSSMANFMATKMDFYKYGLATPIKDLMCTLFGWDERHREGALKETVCEVGPNPQAFFEEWEELRMTEIIGVEMTRKEYVKMIYLLFQDETAKDGPFISPRRAFQLFGTEYARGIKDTVWLELAKRELTEAIAEGSGLILPDVRFRNEHEWVVRNGGVLCHVRREGVAHKIKESGHASESGLRRMSCDWQTPLCSDLVQLEEAASKLAQFLKVAQTADVKLSSRLPTFAQVYDQVEKDKANG